MSDSTSVTTSFMNSLMTPKPLPTFADAEDSLTITMFKDVFRRSGVKAEEMPVNPFAYHSISDWYDANQLDKQVFNEAEANKSSGTLRTPKSPDSGVADLSSKSMGSQVDFNYQEPAFEHATEPQVHLPKPALSAPTKVRTPIRERRMTMHEQPQQKAERCINSISVNINSPTLDLSRTSRKRSAEVAFVAPARAANLAPPKKTRLDDDGYIAASLSNLLGNAPTPYTPDYEYTFPPTPPPSERPDKLPHHHHTTILSPVPANTTADLSTTAPPACPSNFKSWPGQFHGLASTDLLSTTDHSSPLPYPIAWGRPATNANGTIIHHRLPLAAHINTSVASAPRLPPALLATLDAHQDTAASERVACLRSEWQEERRELLHHECAEAQLRGMAVGEWRYGEGALTVEEYVEGGVCVCWEECACAVWCGRWPDLVCPCNEVVEWVE